MYCPIFLDFKNIYLPNLEKPELSSFDLEDLTTATIGSSLYTLKIFTPQTNNQLNIAPSSSIEIRIPNIEPYKNKVRLQLQPSIGYGLTSCYRVEYWKYTPVYLPAGKKGRPSKEKCREEYWRVPAPDRTYILNYEMWYRYKPRFNSLTLQVVEFSKDVESSQLLDNNLDIILINRVNQAGVDFTDYVLTDTSLTNYESPIVSLDWGNSATSGTYQVEYIKPIQHSELIFQDLKGTVLPTATLPYSTPYLYPFGGFPNSFY